jgi:hypothetical protein
MSRPLRLDLIAEPIKSGRMAQTQIVDTGLCAGRSGPRSASDHGGRMTNDEMLRPDPPQRILPMDGCLDPRATRDEHDAWIEDRLRWGLPVPADVFERHGYYPFIVS